MLLLSPHRSGSRNSTKSNQQRAKECLTLPVLVRHSYMLSSHSGRSDKVLLLANFLLSVSAPRPILFFAFSKLSAFNVNLSILEGFPLSYAFLDVVLFLFDAVLFLFAAVLSLLFDALDLEVEMDAPTSPPFHKFLEDASSPHTFLEETFLPARPRARPATFLAALVVVRRDDMWCRCGRRELLYNDTELEEAGLGLGVRVSILSTSADAGSPFSRVEEMAFLCRRTRPSFLALHRLMEAREDNFSCIWLPGWCPSPSSPSCSCSRWKSK